MLSKESLKMCSLTCKTWRRCMFEIDSSFTTVVVKGLVKYKHATGGLTTKVNGTFALLTGRVWM